MNYDDIIQYLFSQLAVFQRDGASAYKPGLQTSISLSKAFGNPHRSYPSVHIAGTNGKGSTAHTLAAILQSAGYRTGLYTSPHLIDFRERIRVDGQMISCKGVVEFMERYFSMNLDLRPSFFELTMMMAFDWFRACDIDIAVIETGLGGRLDSTNIISPLLSVITNISLDHTNLLGSTLESIAAEKAGIIKPKTPVVVGEAAGKILEIFRQKAAYERSPLFLPEQNPEIISVTPQPSSQLYLTVGFGTINSELTGAFQRKNAETILASVKILREKGFEIPEEAIREGFASVCSLTGLMGRWMIVRRNPLVVADTGHNVGGWNYTAETLRQYTSGTKRLVLGFVNDKDISGILSLVATVPACCVYLTRPAINRALPVDSLLSLARSHALDIAGDFPDVAGAYEKALADSGESDMILIGGSNFVVADFLEYFNPSRR